MPVNAEDSAQTCILLVDDDGFLRKMLVQVLREEGYSVLPATDGKRALNVARSFEGRIDLVVTDVMMPSLDGFDLRERIRQERPDVRVLVMSGQLDHEIKGDDFALIRKPFRPENFVAKVREVLSKPASTTAC